MSRWCVYQDIESYILISYLIFNFYFNFDNDTKDLS